MIILGELYWWVFFKNSTQPDLTQLMGGKINDLEEWKNFNDFETLCIQVLLHMVAYMVPI